MDKAKKNEVIRAAAGRMAEIYKEAEIPLYGDAQRMPSRDTVIEIIRDCQKLLFPVYYGNRDLLKLPPEQYSALLMEHIHEKLTNQIALTMSECEENYECAYDISSGFVSRLPAIQELLLKDLAANFDGDPAAYSMEEVLLSYPGMFAIFIYRIAHELYTRKVAMIPRMMSEYAHSQTGIDINPGATIGECFFIDHGTGVVVGETSIIGDNVKLYQGATLGGHADEPECPPPPEDREQRCDLRELHAARRRDGDRRQRHRRRQRVPHVLGRAGHHRQRENARDDLPRQAA